VGDDRVTRGLVSLLLAVTMLVVGGMAARVFPAETRYVFWLFFFGASLFLADAAVTLSRLSEKERAEERARSRAALPWRVAFAVSFVLTLLAAAKTGSSYITATAMLLAASAAVIYLLRRRFFGGMAPLRREDPSSRLKAAFKAGDHAEMVRILEESIGKAPDRSRRNALLLTLGAVHVVRGAYDDAVAAFRRIVGMQTDGVDMAVVVDLNVASALLAKGDFAAAEAVLSEVDPERLPEEFRVAWQINRSGLLVGKGDHAAAIRFLESLPLDRVEAKSRVPFLRDLAEALAASGTDTNRAMEVALQCLSIDDGPQSQNLVGFVLIVQKKFEEAIGRLQAALAANPDGKLNLRVFAETLYYLGLACRGAGRVAEAMGFFQRAASIAGGGRFSRAAAHEAARP